MDLSLPDLMAELMAAHVDLRRAVKSVETAEKYDLTEDLGNLLTDADKLIRMMWNHANRLRVRALNAAEKEKEAKKPKAAPVQQTTPQGQNGTG